MLKTQKRFRRERLSNYLKYADAYPPMKLEGQYCKQWQGYVGEFIAEDFYFPCCAATQRGSCPPNS